jgi:hypothetical protein
MALTYCEVCGVLIQADQPSVSVPEGVICEPCFASRRVEPQEPAPSAEPEFVQFNCCYCQSLLRLKAVPRRTRIRCPKCNDYFYLHEDGRIEAKLEGNTTAVLASPVMNMRPFTPAEGSRPATPATGSLPAAPPPDKTQPMKRQPPQPLPEPSGKQALLKGLEPIKKMDFLDKLADKPKGEDLVDTDAYASTGPPLDLLPQNVGPGKAARTAPREVSLRPSEEGQVDLDAEGLKRKTQKFKSGTTARPTGKRKAEEAAEPEPPTKQGGKKRAPKPDDDEAARADLARDEERAREKREEKERRAAEATRRGAELEAQAAKKGLGALAVLTLAALPAIVCALLLSMTTRGTGFAVRGGVGDRMRDLGGVMDRGIRALGTTLNPALPPGGPKLPETERRG